MTLMIDVLRTIYWDQLSNYGNFVWMIKILLKMMMTVTMIMINFII